MTPNLLKFRSLFLSARAVALNLRIVRNGARTAPLSTAQDDRDCATPVSSEPIQVSGCALAPRRERAYL